MHWFNRTHLIALSFLLTFLSPVGSQSQHLFSSGPEQVSLIELYTSEGCSSCPPADRWLSSLRESPALWTGFVPIAFHVDYWDYLGWRDRFSSATHTKRQRAYAAQWNSSTIYTPGFVIDGNEWRNWGGRSLQSKLSEEKTGTLSAHLNGQSVRVTFKPQQEISRLKGHAALLAMDVRSDIAAGENRGRLLKHDFVVVDHQMINLKKNKSSFSGALSLEKKDADGGPLALAVWVSHRGKPIQSTGGFLE